MHRCYMMLMSRTGVAVAVIFLGACNSGGSAQPSPLACPTDLPEKGSACPLAGVQCGYAKSTSACGVVCDCQGGSWNCGPTCVILVEDASSSGGDDDAGEDGSADSGTGVMPGPTHCVSSTQFAAAEPCPQMAEAGPYRIFECDPDCIGFASVYGGPRCAVGGWTDANVTPLTDADTIVLCCPGDLDASSFECEPPFM